MSFVLCSYRRALGNLPEYFQPAAVEDIDPGITKKLEEARKFSTREEAQMAIPGFQILKREQAKRIRALFKREFGDNPFHQADPILIEPIHVAMA